MQGIDFWKIGGTSGNTTLNRAGLESKIWLDVVGVIKVQSNNLDVDYLRKQE